MNAQNIAKHVTAEDGGYYMHISINEKACGVTVTGIGMYISENDDGDGDLSVSWEIGESEDVDEEEVMQSFYCDCAYNDRLTAVLIEAGFSAEAAGDVTGSEWGMQDVGLASYDAGKIADEVRAAMQLALA